tara:strand:+ start:950 stop:1150 length:201 start_codon:yes stop_codon:yes gene_type:complete
MNTLIKTLFKNRFNAACEAITAREIATGNWSTRTAAWAEFWIVRPGDYGFSAGIEIAKNVRVYGEC